MKTLALSIIAVLVSQFSSAGSTIDLGTNAGYTPYDRYMSPVKQVLAHLNGQSPSMDKVCQLMSQGRNFRYSFTDPYTAATPDVTASLHAGDCKAKSLWLADQLNDPSVRFVIGKARSTSRISHAWLMWKSEGRWWILDCTNTRQPIPADRINPEKEYIPLYSFGKDGSYRHHATSMSLASSVAGQTKNVIAAN
jgi:hypothetical protein